MSQPTYGYTSGIPYVLSGQRFEGTQYTPALAAAVAARIGQLQNVELLPDRRLRFTLPNGDQITTAAAIPPPPANEIGIGSVSTLATGTPATASITGAFPDQKLNLGLPRGLTGAKGDKGAPGEKGEPGDVPGTRQIIAGQGLTGGGNLSADRTLSVDEGWSPKNVTAGNVDDFTEPGFYQINLSNTPSNSWGALEVYRASSSTIIQTFTAHTGPGVYIRRKHGTSAFTDWECIHGIDVRVRTTSTQTANSQMFFTWGAGKTEGATRSGSTITLSRAASQCHIYGWVQFDWSPGSGQNRTLKLVVNGSTVRSVGADFTRVLGDSGTAAGILSINHVMDLPSGAAVRMSLETSGAGVGIAAGNAFLSIKE